MNWSKVLLGGIVAGIVGNIVDFVQHGLIMGDTYTSLPEVFSQEQANPLWFFVASVGFWVSAAWLFGKTRSSWGAGAKGGAFFGLVLGIVGMWANFYDPLVIADYPYYLSWCWSGMGVITGVVAGAVLGALYKEA